MRLFLSVCICFSIFSSQAKNQIRELKLNYKGSCIDLTEIQKELIVDEYIAVGNGDWLNITTISNKAYKADRKQAHQLAKKRNRIVSKFLVEKGLDISEITYKYNVLEHVWIHKPYHFTSSVELDTEMKSLDANCYNFYNKQGLTAFLPSGNSIIFKANSFNVFSDKEIQLCIEEYASKTDFVKYGVTAKGNKGMLESQGMYKITAKCNGKEVHLRRGVNYELSINNGKMDHQYFSFYGNVKDGKLAWNKNPNEKFAAQTIMESGVESFEGAGEFIGGEMEWESEVTKLSGKFSKLGWINCDRFVNEVELVSMDFKIDGDDESNPLNVFIVFHDLNSVMPAERVMSGVYTISGIPKSSNISVVAIAVNEKEPIGKMGFVQTTTDNNKVVKLYADVLTKDQIGKTLDDVVY